MARLDPAPEASRSVLTRFWLWLLRRVMGRDLKPYGIAAHAPRLVPGLAILNAVFEMGDWTIEPALRKLVHLRVASLIGCVF